MTMTTPLQPPPLDIHRYHVEELVFRSLSEYDPDKKTASVIDVNFDVQQDEVAPRDYRISLRIQLAANGYAAEENAPYTVGLTIVGYFTFSETTADDVRKRMIFTNGPAILFGIARGIAGQPTGAAKHRQFVLPTVDFLAIEKARVQRELEEAQRQLAELGATTTEPESTEEGVPEEEV